jgi:quercetin dioxygenase-like cupin family protein
MAFREAGWYTSLTGAMDLWEESAMRVERSRGKWLAVATGVAVIGILGAAVALASPGSGVTPTNFVTADLDQTFNWNSDRIKIQTKGATDVRVQRLDFAAGSFTGWHHHPGIVIVAVESGALTFWQADCSSVTYGPGLPDGEVFIEGGDHAVQATSATGATVYVTYIAPSADPPVFRIENDAITC